MNSIFDIILVPFGKLIELCYKLIPNYAVALLIFAVLIKVVLFPLGIKQQKNSVKQAQLRPREQAIRKRYAGRNDAATQQKMNEELQAFYRSENFNPAGGCLPLLIELPLLLAVYNVVTNPLRYLMGWSKETITAVAEAMIENGALNVSSAARASQIGIINILRGDLGTYASVIPEGTTLASFPDFSLFRGWLDLSQTPSITNWTWLMLIPLAVLVGSWASMKLTRKFTYQPETDQQTALSMKIMDWTMPLFSLWISFSVPGIVGLYWVYQNLLSVLRQMVLYKMYPTPVWTEEDYKKAELEMNGKLSKAERKKAKAQRSLHNIDDEIPDTPENTLQEEKAPAEPKAGLSAGALKDDGAVKRSDAPKKKVRSLHHIDDEIPDTPENTLMLDENGKRIRSPKPEDAANAEAKSEEPAKPEENEPSEKKD